MDGYCIGNGADTVVAVRFQVPASSAYRLNSVTIRTHGFIVDTPHTMTLHDDSMGATQPGNQITMLGTLPGGPVGSFHEYTFSGGDNLLAAGMIYWLALSTEPIEGCAATWLSSEESPTGIFTYLGAAWYWASPHYVVESDTQAGWWEYIAASRVIESNLWRYVAAPHIEIEAERN